MLDILIEPDVAAREDEPREPCVRTREARDYRAERRERCLLPARVELAKDFGSVDCVIRNISLSGAQLVCSPATPLPVTFSLVIPSRRASMRARVRWSDGVFYGVAFECDREVEPADMSALASRLERLETVNLDLRRRVAALERDRLA